MSFSFLARRSAQTFLRRSYTATPQQVSSPYLAEQDALRHHAADATELWRKISYYFCAPAVITCVAWVYNAEAEHAAHIKHLKAENGGHLPEIPAFDYMNRRSKPFPWGMNSLFYNPHVNKDLAAE